MNKIQPRVSIAPHLHFVENAATTKMERAPQKRRKAQIAKTVYFEQ